MNRILINIYLLFFVFMGYGQKIEKKTIYLNFTEYKLKCIYDFHKPTSKLFNKAIFYVIQQIAIFVACP